MQFIKDANNIKASNINPLVASTFISIQIEAPAAKGAKKAAFKYNIYSNFSSDDKEQPLPFNKRLKTKGFSKKKAIFKGKKLIFYKLVEIEECLYAISNL